MRSATLALIGLALLAPAAGAAPPPTTLQCGDVVTTDTLLANDLSCGSSYQAALTIGAPGITLDLGGHKIVASRVGVLNEGHDGVTIKNGELGTEEGGVDLVGVTGNVVRDLEVGGLFEAITLRDSDGNRIVHNTTVSNHIALREGSDRNTVARNVVTRYESHLVVEDSVENRIVDNIAWTEDSDTLILRRAHRNTVRGNTLVTSSGSSLISMTASNANEVVDNLIVEHEGFFPAGPAVVLDGSNRNLFARNTLSNVPLGIWVRSGNGNVLRRNVATGKHYEGFVTGDRQPDGFLVAPAAQRTILVGNTATGFDDDGFTLWGAQTEAGGNTANDNGDYGIEASPPAIDLGGNRASGNGNPTAQCVGVVCQ